jgi:hypothetical protein
LRVGLQTAAAVVLAAGIVTAALLLKPLHCNQVTVCIRPPEGGCLPGPCDLARQRRHHQAEVAVVVGIVGAILLGVAARRVHVAPGGDE